MTVYLTFYSFTPTLAACMYLLGNTDKHVQSALEVKTRGLKMLDIKGA